MPAIQVADPEIHAACACHDNDAGIAMRREEFSGQFDGSIAVRVGAQQTDRTGLPVVPLHIVGYSTSSRVRGLGKVTLDFDFSRPIRASELKGRSRRSFFPGVQTMRLNILMSVDTMPGVVLQSRTPGTLINRNADSFPPSPGSTYVLQRPVELVDRRRANGRTVARLTRVNTEIRSTELDLEQINVGTGIQLQRDPETGWTHNGSVRETRLRFSLAVPGRAAVVLLDAQRRPMRTLSDETRRAGRHVVAFDSRQLRGSRYYWQLSMDGVKRTAPMLLIQR
ncbi:MAG: hypothetical protein ACYDH6_19495 [Acidimicrobiales bacterium]